MRDNALLILADGTLEGHIRRRKQRNGPYYFEAWLWDKRAQREIIRQVFGSYDEAEARVMAWAEQEAV